MATCHAACLLCVGMRWRPDQACHAASRLQQAQLTLPLRAQDRHLGSRWLLRALPCTSARLGPWTLRSRWRESWMVYCCGTPCCPLVRWRAHVHVYCFSLLLGSAHGHLPRVTQWWLQRVTDAALVPTHDACSLACLLCMGQCPSWVPLHWILLL